MDLNLLLQLADGANHAQEWITWLADYSYLGVFLFLLACGFGFPVPEEIALAAGGYAIYEAGLIDPSKGDFDNALMMVAVSLAGVLIGDCTIYFWGRKMGQRPDKIPFIGRHLTPRRMAKARALFHRYGPKMVFFGRFLVGIRPVIFFVAGSLRLPITTFLGMNGLAAAISVPTCVLLAWHFGGELESAIRYLGGFERVLGVIGALGVAAVLVVMWRKRKVLDLPSSDELTPYESGSGSGRHRRHSARCPLCKEDVEEEEERPQATVRCPSCQTLYHEPCYREAARPCALGCNPQPVPAEPRS